MVDEGRQRPSLVDLASGAVFGYAHAQIGVLAWKGKVQVLAWKEKVHSDILVSMLMAYVAKLSCIGLWSRDNGDILSKTEHRFVAASRVL